MIKRLMLSLSLSSTLLIGFALIIYDKYMPRGALNDEIVGVLMCIIFFINSIILLPFYAIDQWRFLTVISEDGLIFPRNESSWIIIIALYIIGFNIILSIREKYKYRINKKKSEALKENNKNYI